ncbi:MAG: hypothetical protein OEM23_07875, partial [Gemmatimonadota bacterium]|nr:hypothetical protein [Gemmatimonadota bacterium]
LPTGHELLVNGTFFQRTINLDKNFLAANSDLFPEWQAADYLSYNFPYRVQPKVDRVLIVGAGTGNDVAAALRNGASHVDAVEIDPVIAAIGERFHPERPYTDPRVNLIVDDARSFLRKTRNKYDLIVFATLDSHTLNSSLSNIRIDDYVYTVQSFKEARDLLTDEGAISLVFAIEHDFIGERLFGMLREAFGRPPIVFRNAELESAGGAGGGPMFLIDRDGRIEERIAGDSRAAQIISSRRMQLDGQVPLGTDDWPYLYLESRRIPQLYLIVMGIVVLFTAIMVKPRIGGVRQISPHFFLLGAGFLLIEVQSISKIALILGTTWHVNAIVITGVLTMILLGNLTAAKLRFRSLTGIYLALAASIVLNYLFPFESLLPFPAWMKAIIAGAIMSLPIFFASLVFILTFAGTERSGAALGSNLFGAILGGMFESASFWLGINALGMIALAFYAGSLLYLGRKGVSTRIRGS